jgi:hypothetical protein
MSTLTLTQWIDIHAPLFLFVATVAPGLIWLAWDCLSDLRQDIHNL